MKFECPTKEAGLWRGESHLLDLKVFSIKRGKEPAGARGRYGVKEGVILCLLV